MASIPIVPDEFELRSFPGAEGQPPFDVLLQRCDPEALLIAARWPAIETEAAAEINRAEDVAAFLFRVQCEDMAARIKNTDGEPWNVATLRALAGRSIEAWQWLRSELFSNAPAGGAPLSHDAGSSELSQLVSSILPWRPETAGPA